MNRRGFLASLLAAPLAPAAAPANGLSHLEGVTVWLEPGIYTSPLDLRAEYIRSFNRARDLMIFREFSRG